MKYLILLLVVLAVIWLGRSLSRPKRRSGAAPAGDAPKPVGHEDLPACAHCGVYLPRSEALAGPDGIFCSEAHRRAFKARGPSA